MIEMQGVDLLDRENEAALIGRWQACADREARDRLVESNVGLVMKIARSYTRYGLTHDDLVGEGFLGLLKAIDRFDLDRNVRFSTYAVFWIRAEILRALKKEWSGWKTYAAGGNMHDISLSWTPSGEDWTAVEERMADDRCGPDVITDRLDREARMRDLVQTAMLELNCRERQVASDRLMCDPPRTLADLGQSLGVSRERVRQIESRTKRKLKESLASAGVSTASLGSFLTDA